MNQIISIALLIGGIVLLVFGISAVDSFSSDVSRFFTGTPTDRSVWLIILGTVLCVAGLAGTFFTSRRHT
ncbi:MAG: DUF3185 family protein [Puniceicoccaceae bacterium]|nr:MAG: DUF3185 family protein [Puniceicoccaceae bacterium]